MYIDIYIYIKYILHILYLIYIIFLLPILKHEKNGSCGWFRKEQCCQNKRYVDGVGVAILGCLLNNEIEHMKMIEHDHALHGHKGTTIKP